MNVRRYQKWAKSGLAIMLAGAMMVEQRHPVEG